jgi:membrane-bound metal-dependent hydrolase YbcI (DUF457 family)
MPLPVAHALLGASCVAALAPRKTVGRGRILLVGALLGVCPDFDYFISLFGRGWRHDFTHSFAFTFLLGLTAAFVFSRDLRPRSVTAYWLPVLSHPLIDFVMTESRGVELFWPLSDRRFRLGGPTLLDYTWRNDSLAATALDLLRIALMEFAIFAPLLFVVLVARWTGGRRTASSH